MATAILYVKQWQAAFANAMVHISIIWFAFLSWFWSTSYLIYLPYILGNIPKMYYSRAQQIGRAHV